MSKTKTPKPNPADSVPEDMRRVVLNADGMGTWYRTWYGMPPELRKLVAPPVDISESIMCELRNRPRVAREVLRSIERGYTTSDGAASQYWQAMTLAAKKPIVGIDANRWGGPVAAHVPKAVAGEMFYRHEQIGVAFDRACRDMTDYFCTITDCMAIRYLHAPSNNALGYVNVHSNWAPANCLSFTYYPSIKRPPGFKFFDYDYIVARFLLIPFVWGPTNTVPPMWRELAEEMAKEAA